MWPRTLHATDAVEYPAAIDDDEIAGGEMNAEGAHDADECRPVFFRQRDERVKVDAIAGVQARRQKQDDFREVGHKSVSRTRRRRMAGPSLSRPADSWARSAATESPKLATIRTPERTDEDSSFILPASSLASAVGKNRLAILDLLVGGNQ